MHKRVLVAALLLVAPKLWAGLPEGTVWIDVRSAEEFSEGHLEGAILIPHDEIDAGIRKLDLSSDTPIYLYCRSGRRAGMARDRLHELNYNTVINVGGIDDARRLTGQD